MRIQNDQTRSEIDPLHVSRRFERDRFIAGWRKLDRSSDRVNFPGSEVVQFVQQFPTSCLIEHKAPAVSRICASGTKFSELLDSTNTSQCLSDIFRNQAGELTMELLEAAFVLPANLSIPVVSDGNPWRRPVHGEITVLPIAVSGEKTRFALVLLSLNSDKKISGLSFEMSKSRSFKLTPFQPKTHAPIRPELSKPRLVFSNVSGVRKRTVS